MYHAYSSDLALTLACRTSPLQNLPYFDFPELVFALVDDPSAAHANDERHCGL